MNQDRDLASKAWLGAQAVASGLTSDLGSARSEPLVSASLSLFLKWRTGGPYLAGCCEGARAGQWRPWPGPGTRLRPLLASSVV